MYLSGMPGVMLSATLTTVVNEDNVTVVELNRINTRKINECVKAINSVIKQCESLMQKVNFSVEGEQLSYTITEKFEQLKGDALALEEATAIPHSYDTLSAIELAGCTANYVNACAKLVNELTANVAELDNLINIDVIGDELLMPIGED